MTIISAMRQDRKTTGAQIVSNFEVCMYLSARRGKHQPWQYGRHDRLRPFKVSLTRPCTRQEQPSMANPSILAARTALSLAQGWPSLYIWATPIFFRHGLIAEIYAPKIGWCRSATVHHEREDGGARGQAFFTSRPPFPAITGLRSSRSGRKPLRRGDGGTFDKGRGARIGEALLF